MEHVVAGIIFHKNVNGKIQYLLVKSNENFGEFTHYWYPPGGHMEEGEDERHALIRELKEELNLAVEPIKKIAETPGDIKDSYVHWWVCDCLSDAIKINEEEIAEVGWFTVEEMEIMKIWPATRIFLKSINYEIT